MKFMLEYLLTFIQGDQVSEDEPISLPFYRCVPINDDLQFTESIYDCEQDKAPEYSNQDGGSSK